ncbi:tetraacyldisaccharide 4'-kinase [Desulfovibrio sp. OttesenSCG-928-O18]|nr:tetraacyldisaccharide 4'-kinase [Desulfovibrio sp. OttesenSCG-928-O18]
MRHYPRMNLPSLQRHLRPVLRPFGAAYAGVMRLRALRYGTGTRSFRAACPVVSVGNISWGGTGKTPIVDYLLDKAAEDGVRAVVLTRGYKAAPQELPFPVGREDDPAVAGDEPLLLARRHPEALVLVDPKRSRAAAWAERHAAPQLFLLDDGMQHMAMERDLDIVLLKPEDLLDEWDRVIPSGTWREGKSALARAHAFCMKADPAVFSGIIPVAEKRLAAFGRPLFRFSLQPIGLSRLEPFGDAPSETVSGLKEADYTLLCGTGNPTQVRETAHGFLGRAAAAEIIRPDHHPYMEADALHALRLGHPVVCTAKDAVKLAALLPYFGDLPVWVLEVRAVFGEALFTDRPFDAWWREQWRALAALRFEAGPP